MNYNCIDKREARMLNSDIKLVLFGGKWKRQRGMSVGNDIRISDPRASYFLVKHADI
jgi:hypothetical protein